MKTIQIDNDLYKFLQERAIPYEEPTVLETIKRLVGFKNNPEVLPRRTILSASKREKTNLPEMVAAGILQDGQPLIFTDYQRKTYPEHKVTLKHGRLIYEERHYSMSELASIFLKKLGFSSSAVRGPQFWSTDSGDLVMELWDKYLAEHQHERMKLV